MTITLASCVADLSNFQRLLGRERRFLLCLQTLMSWEDSKWASAGKNGLYTQALELHQSSNTSCRGLSLRSLQANFAGSGVVIKASSCFFVIMGKAKQVEPFILGSQKRSRNLQNLRGRLSSVTPCRRTLRLRHLQRRRVKERWLAA